MGAGGALYGDIKVYGYGLRLLTGSFAPNGSSALASTGFKGKGVTPAYTSTGTYTLTLHMTYLALVSWWVNAAIASAATVDISLQLGAVDVASAKTVVIRNNPGGSVADIAANAGNRVGYGLVLATSGLNT